MNTSSPITDALPGRSCRLSYRYSPAVFNRPADLETETLYVIGGLYGNVPALDAIDALMDNEPVTPTLVFNGDFNWFNTDDKTFDAINKRGAALKQLDLARRFFSAGKHAPQHHARCARGDGLGHIA